MTKTAVLVDGGFYRKRAYHHWGERCPAERADELMKYVFRHLDKKDGPCTRELYRIFYYDCPPMERTVFHPLHGNIEFRKLDGYRWALDFFDELKRCRKVALRMGRLSDTGAYYELTPDATKRVVGERTKIEELKDSDFRVAFKQKGVDMRMGVDISSLAYEGIVDQIVLIAGDSDFVPAAKAARRKGIDFILDPMGNQISDDLFEHIDGMESFIREGDPLKPKKRSSSKSKGKGA